jgi:hypothetical protein
MAAASGGVAFVAAPELFVALGVSGIVATLNKWLCSWRGQDRKDFCNISVRDTDRAYLRVSSSPTKIKVDWLGGNCLDLFFDDTVVADALGEPVAHGGTPSRRFFRKEKNIETSRSVPVVAARDVATTAHSADGGLADNSRPSGHRGSRTDPD